MSKKTGKTLAISLLMVLLMSIFGPPMRAFANETSETEYQVQKNDNLYRIARTQLGSGERWTDIYELNKDVVKDPSLIYIGQMLKLPDLTADLAEAPEAVEKPEAPEAVEKPEATETIEKTEVPEAKENPEASELIEKKETTKETEATSSDEQSEADKYAKQLYDAASKVEADVTAVLKSMENDKAHLEGLENRLKTIESTSRKILLNSHDMEISIPEAAKTITDSLRYTFVIEDPDYVETTRQITDTLIARGYKVNKFKNYWVNNNVVYQGINALFQTHEGVIFELQFHTPISYYTKGEKTHGYYEIIRSETATEEEKAQAQEKHDAAFAEIPVPEGVETLSY